MLKWKVSLIGNPSHLRTLVNLGVGVSEESSGFVLRHRDLDDQTDGAVVRERAIKMVEALNGLGRLAASTFHPVTVGGVGATHDGGIIVVPAPVETRIGTAELAS